MATPKAKKAKASDDYKAVVLIWGKKYEAKGGTLSAALSALKVPNPKGKSILTITKGDVSKERILSPVATFRLLNSQGLMREVAIKNTSLMFGL